MVIMGLKWDRNGSLYNVLFGWMYYLIGIHGFVILTYLYHDMHVACEQYSLTRHVDGHVFNTNGSGSREE